MRKLCSIGIIVLSLAFVVQGHAADVVVPAPNDVAFNRGFLLADAISEQTGLGRISVRYPDSVTTVVRHMWIETFENDAKSSIAMTTAFAVCDSTFKVEMTADGNRSFLRGFAATFILLDYAGRPLGSPRRITISFSQNTQSWTRSESDAGDLVTFFNSLDDITKKNLRRTSGFLSRYPGQNSVPYLDDILKAKYFRILGMVLAVTVPEPAAALPEDVAVVPLIEWIVKAVQDVLKDLGVDSLKDRYSRDLVRWGQDSFPSDKRIQDDPDTYEQAGALIWPGFPDNLDGVWKTDRDQFHPDGRFRLEITGASAVWIEENSNRLEVRRATTIVRQSDGSYRIDRPNDAEVVALLYPTPANRQAVMRQNPKPSFFLIDDVSASTMSGEFHGILLNPTTLVLAQPEDADPRDANFKRMTFAPPAQ